MKKREVEENGERGTGKTRRWKKENRENNEGKNDERMRKVVMVINRERMRERDSTKTGWGNKRKVSKGEIRDNEKGSGKIRR